MASSTTDAPQNFLQVVDDIIGASLIDHALNNLGAESATEGIYTELKWTVACEDLLRTYREQKHKSVVEIATFVKPHTDTQRTFKMVARINPSTRKIPERRIGLPTDYHIIIPFVLQGLPIWAEDRSSNVRQKIAWKKGSVVCIKGGTNLICTEEGGGVYMIIGGETKKQP